MYYYLRHLAQAKMFIIQESKRVHMNRRSVIALGTAMLGGLAGCSSFETLQTRQCPEFDDADADECLWYSSSLGTDVYLEPSQESVELPNGEVLLTLHNESDAYVNTNFGALRGYRKEGDQWRLVLPGTKHAGENMLPPGETHTWRVGFGSTSRFGSRVVPLREATPGKYVFFVDGWRESRANTVGYVATVRAMR